MPKTQAYGNNSITMLKGPDRVRKRPAVIFGSEGLEGCEHCAFEILSNAVDEAKEGFGDRIVMTVWRDHSMQVEDFGRGVPLGWNEKEGKFNWELVYCELYAGGKYNNNEKSAYEYSLGLNGLGACATQYASSYMDVYSYDGLRESAIHFKKGYPDGELAVRELPKKDRRTGTIVRWLPDLEVFTDIAISKEYFQEMLRKQAVVNAGVTFILLFENEGGEMEQFSYFYQNGILDYVTELAADQALTSPQFFSGEAVGRDRADKDEYKVKMSASFCFSNQVNDIEYYHNSSFLEHGGSPEKAVKNAFVFAIDKYLRLHGKYNKNEAKIAFQDVEDCLILVTNCFSAQASYANQTKKAITNVFIAEAMTDFLKRNLEVYFAEKPEEAEKLSAQVLINKRSRENAESARITLKTQLSGSIDVANRVEKFISCRSKDPEVRELYIVEGDSAAGSCKASRSAEFQAIMPVRGKTLNCLKAPYDKIFKSEIITDLLRVIGCGVEIKGKVKGNITPFSLESLKWSKIIICTDADKDGYQIRTLILTLFYRLLPTLIEKGKVYIVESPLYEINTKTETFYAYNEKEKSDILHRIGDGKYTIQRSKGLGENDPEMMALTTMSPATRRLIRVCPTDAEETFRIFDALLGDNIEARKAFIAEKGKEYCDDLDTE